MPPKGTRLLSHSTKTLCDWSKRELQDDAKKLAALVKDASYYCQKCARVANDKKVLCKAKKLPD